MHMQYIASAVDKMKIEPEDRIIQGGLQDDKSKWWFVAKENCNPLFVFQKFQMDGNWSECLENLRIFFSGRVKLNSSSGWVDYD